MSKRKSMSRGQITLVSVVFLVGLAVIPFGEVAAFAVGCLYAILAAFFIGAFIGRDEADGVVERMRFYWSFAVLLPWLGGMMVSLYIYSLIPVWKMYGVIMAGLLSMGFLMLIELKLTYHTSWDRREKSDDA